MRSKLVAVAVVALARVVAMLGYNEFAARSQRNDEVRAKAAIFADADHISIVGPELALPVDLALPLSLVLHELATNATKYGSLGVSSRASLA